MEALLREISVSLARLDEKLTAHVEREEIIAGGISDHIKESEEVRPEIIKNTTFRRNGIWVIRSLWGAVLMIAAKMLFIDR